MKKLFALILISTLSLSACKKEEAAPAPAPEQVQAQPAEPPVSQPPEDQVGQAAPPLRTPSTDPICVESNYVRMKICATQQVDCRTIMQVAKPELVQKIQACEPDKGPDTFTGEQVVGGIPCCVPMGKVVIDPAQQTTQQP